MANCVDPDQTAVCSGSTLFASILYLSVVLGNYLQQTTSADDIFRCIFSWRFNGLKVFMLFSLQAASQPVKNLIDKLLNKLANIHLQSYKVASYSCFMLLNSQRLNYTVYILDHVKNLISVDTHVNQHL